MSGLWIENRLREWFVKEATVIDYEKGYVSVPGVNQRVDLEMQGLAADLIVNHYRCKDIKFDVVVGVPSSGIPLANSVAERLGCPLAPGRKGTDIPGSWRNKILVDGGESYTTGKRVNFVFNGINKGDKALVIEDVVARGNTMKQIIEKFKEEGIETYLATYFSKAFQGGMEIIREMGVETFAAIEIASLSQEKNDSGLVGYRVNLAPPHFA